MGYTMKAAAAGARPLAAWLVAGALGVAAGALASPVHAGDSRLVLGAVIGGGAGAAIGQSIGGRDAAIIGSAIGAAAGAAVVATQPRSVVHAAPVHDWPGQHAGIAYYPHGVHYPAYPQAWPPAVIVHAPPVVVHRPAVVVHPSVPSFHWGPPTVVVQIHRAGPPPAHGVPPGHARGHPGRGHGHGHGHGHAHGKPEWKGDRYERRGFRPME
jgi:hypothetical protein